MKCEKCGQEIKVKVLKRKTMDIWRNINLLLGLNWDVDEERVADTQTKKGLLKLENAIKNIIEKNNGKTNIDKGEINQEENVK